MKNGLLLILAFFVSTAAFSQKKKVTVDGDTIKVDGTSYALIERKTPATPVYTIKSLAGKPLMNWQFQDFNDSREVNNANKNGRVTYFQVTFFHDKQQCEINPNMATYKGIAKCIVDNDLIKDDAIDQEAENNFVLINGMKFSEQKRSSGNGTTVIINNNR